VAFFVGLRQPLTSFDKDIPLLEGFIHKNDKPEMLEKARELIKKGLRKWTSKNRSNWF